MRNLTMMTDLYELTMMNGYLRFGMENNRACFDIFYRKQGDMTAYAVAAGLEQAVEYVKNLHFSKDDIAYLRSLNIFDEAFLTRLSTLRFTGEILAVPEGTVIFPGEPRPPAWCRRRAATACWNSVCAARRGRMRAFTVRARR